MPFHVHEILMSLIECFFLGQSDMDIPVALAAVDLSDDFESQCLVIFDIFVPISQLGSILTPDNLIKDLLGH